MSGLVARTGRHQQRYEAGCRLIAGCIPFKHRNPDEGSNENSEKVVEVLMINSPSGPGLLFPKGGWENDETVEEAAIREAIEEAGVRGVLMLTWALTPPLLKIKSRFNQPWDICARPPLRVWMGVMVNCWMRRGNLRFKCMDPAETDVGNYGAQGKWENDCFRILRFWPLEYAKFEFLGHYHFKSKTLQDEFSPEGSCKAAMFALFVKEELESWPEQNTRRRSWLTIPEAYENCRHPWMREALKDGFSKWHENKISTGETFPDQD
ncbi:Nudix hydrolase 16, mitochondrial [Vitis vinifera]|uniref:Nudix hydrolase 16, mitochondrial n=1 Tax=Vitis vinifera TaxID=29760 RepID=A0A438DLR9_VITVI|nr:Nudix hydrolase 16, mitochondrial [Vitis vinifera]